jgi:conjugative relaxase-like TrwC/TraI family protein
VLRIARLRAGRESYYLSQVADGAEDYYLRSGEAPGRWIGAGTKALALDGEVAAEDLRSVLRGVGPGGQLLARASRKTPGFDLTFRAPKSVSLLFALGAPAVSRQVIAAHDAAVVETMGYLERWACLTRRGARGIHSIRGSGFVAAAFRHRTSRAGDPTLHTHVLIANAVLADGSWGALDARFLFRETRAAQDVYQAVLRAELTERLGVDWQPVRHGFADVSGFTRHMIEAFSTRRQEIEAVLASRGERSAAAAGVAALATRTPKGTVDFAALESRWRTQGARVGVTERIINSLLHRRDRSQVGVPTGTAEWLVSPDGLTRNQSSFDRRDVVRAWCGLLPHGAHATTIDTLAEGLLASPEILALSASASAAAFERSLRRVDGTRIPTPALEPRYTTHELAGVERAMVASAVEQQDNGCAVVDETIVDAAIWLRPSLSDEQQTMVRRLTCGGDGVSVVIGKAGAGKTLALDAARAAWQASGHTVVGTSLAARAAAQLESDAGIPAATLARLERELTHHPLTPTTVVIVDEAAMIGTRDLARLQARTSRARAKLVLVGDDRQLPAIAAGGGFRALADRLAPIRLHTNRRQVDAWEADALDDLAAGRAAKALAAYDDRGRITYADNADVLREQLVTDWAAARRDGAGGPMLALQRDDVADLNRRARRHLKRHGDLVDEAVFWGRAFAVGDQVVGLRNHYRSGILNGTTGTITDLHPDEGAITMRTPGGVEIRLPRSYLRRGYLDHAYAITVHKTQGATYHRAFVLGDDRLYREAGYVALSRARQGTHLYTIATDDDEHGTHERRASDERLRSALRRSRQEPSITELRADGRAYF